MTIESAKVKIKTLLEKRGFQESKEGLFTVDTGASKVGIELFGERPIVGVFINNKLEDEGHGIEAVYNLRSQVLAVWDREINRGVSEQPAPKPESNKIYTIRHPPGDTVPEPVDKEKLKEAFKKTEEKTQSQPKPVEVVAPEKTEHKPTILVPSRITTPQGNYIKGLVPMMKEIGKIKIGTKGEVKTSQKGTQYRPPVKFDHFEIVSILRDDNGNLIPDTVMQELGEKPRELDIFLIYNDETLNFTTRYNEYKGGKCQCSGDGVKARLINGDEIECNPDTCKVFKEKRCKPNGILSVILTKSPRLGGVYKFRTTSYNSIRSILSSLFFIKSLTGGVLAMIPLKLTVSPMTVQPKDSVTAQTIYVVNVEFAGTVQQLLEKTVEVSKYQSMMRANIKQLEATARASLAIPESEEEGKEVQAEFYPEKPEEAKAEVKS